MLPNAQPSSKEDIIMSPEDLRHSSEAPLLEINNKLDEFENNLNDLNTQKSQ